MRIADPLAPVRFLVCALAALVLGSASARAQALIKVNDEVNVRLGVLGQFQADAVTDPTSDEAIKNLFIRRIRLLVGGQVAKHVTFFMETDAPNLGRTLAGGKNIQPSLIVQDAYAEIAVSPALLVDAGLMYVPFSRNSVQSGATLLPIDYGPYTFAQSAPTQSSTGRDTGFQARGSVAARRLEYRIGAFQGVRDARSHNGFRYVGRAQYNVFDTESGYFYTGTYLGAKRILAVGAAFDAQESYRGYDVDAFLDLPMAGGALTAQIAFNRFDGDTLIPGLATQRTLLAEAGYYFTSLKLTPVVQISRRDLDGVSAGDETRMSFGANYWLKGHNTSLKAAYTHIGPAGQPAQHQVTAQLQIFYY